MIAILFIVIFLFFAWLGLVLCPSSEYEILILTYCWGVGLAAVVITGFTIVIKKLDVLCDRKAKEDNEKKEGPKDKEEKAEKENID